MTFICPKPRVWDRVYQQLQKAWEAAGCVGPEPPVPLILAGWSYSNDLDKHQRWTETLVWADNSGFGTLIPELSEADGYWVAELTSKPGGPID